MAVKRILVIDDEPDILTLARMGLELAPGWEVLTACTPAEGLRQAAEGHPDAILLDLTFPDVDGLDVLAELRQSEATRAIPVLVVSARLSGAQVKAYDVAGVVEKPFDVTTLAEKVASRLGW